MSEHDRYENTTRLAESGLASERWITPASVRATGNAGADTLPDPANENLATLQVRMTPQLPAEIQAAIREWAEHLRTMPWNLRRRAIKRFAGSFADNVLAVVPHLSDEEYDSLTDIGVTCMLEQLDDGGPIRDAHQARCYLESVHGHHQAMGQAFLATTRPKAATLH